MSNKKVYFASDFHLGVPTHQESLVREKKIVEWLSLARKDALEVFLVGDLFDFWFEYKHAIPKGFVRLQAAIADTVDQGIPVSVFTGNHDMWMFDYLTKELGVTMHREPIERTFYNKAFLIGHGDGLGPGDHGYKFIKKVFSNKVCQWLFARLHPNFGIGLAQYWSRRSRQHTGNDDDHFLGEDGEWLIHYCQDILQSKPIDYFIFGHRHLPIEHDLSPTSKYVNLGDWIKYYTYAVFDGETLQLKKFESDN